MNQDREYLHIHVQAERAEEKKRKKGERALEKNPAHISLSLMWNPVYDMFCKNCLKIQTQFFAGSYPYINLKTSLKMK